ncbi:hypothetical protein P9A30_gp40 [Sphingomonas phage Lucius]|uniref:Uncharacterized protein n=1 Tax=Sphingomonas phage Lucius TaxID=2686313 RepID=A0A6M3TC39_9CAUD|nr:hypothetical protein P9A30_gp40 [Sphingomonas phage Lucius]QJD54482.1 hypothetical protein [Sphingomonas phage Lucius]
MDIHNLKSSDVLTLDQALEATVLGYRVRADDMQPGAYIDYQFAGFRINFPGGSSSGWSSRPHDETVEWHVIDDPEPVKVEMTFVTSKEQATRLAQHDRNKWGQPILTPKVSDMLVLDPATGKWVEAGSVPPGTYDMKLKPDPAPANVGKWGKAVVPKKDSWGRPI